MQKCHPESKAELIEHISKGVPVDTTETVVTPIDSNDFDFGANKESVGMFFSGSNAVSYIGGHTADKVLGLLGYLRNGTSCKKQDLVNTKKQERKQSEIVQDAILSAVDNVLRANNGVTEIEVDNVINAICKDDNLDCLTQEKEFALRRFIKEEIASIVEQAKKDPKEEVKMRNEINRATYAITSRSGSILKFISQNSKVLLGKDSVFAILKPKERQRRLQIFVEEVVEAMARLIKKYPKMQNKELLNEINDLVRAKCLKNEILRNFDRSLVEKFISIFEQEANFMIFNLKNGVKLAKSADELDINNIEKLIQKENIGKFTRALQTASVLWKDVCLLDMPWESDLKKRLHQLVSPDVPLEQKVKLIECFLWTLKTKGFECKDQPGDAGKSFIRHIIASLEAGKFEELREHMPDFEAGILDYDSGITIQEKEDADKLKKSKKVQKKEGGHDKWRTFEARESDGEKRKRIMSELREEAEQKSVTDRLILIANAILSNEDMQEIEKRVRKDNPDIDENQIQKAVKRAIAKEASLRMTPEALGEIKAKARDYLGMEDHSFVMRKFANRYDNEENKVLTHGEVTSRDKDTIRIALKMLNKPKALATNLVTDFMGIRSEVPDMESALNFVRYLMREGGKLKSTSRRDSIKFRSKNVFTSDEEDDREIEMLQLGFAGFEHTDATKYEFFQDMKIVGETLEGVSYEIQIVLVGNTNETGLAHHAIYEACQVANAIAREFKGISEAQLQKLEERAFDLSTDPVAKKAKILEDLQKKEFLKQNPDISAEELEKNPEQYKEQYTAIKRGKDHVNGIYGKCAKEKKEGIRARIRENLLEVRPGFFIALEKSQDHRLSHLDLLDPEIQGIITTHYVKVHGTIEQVLSDS